MEDITEWERRKEDLKKYTENPEAFIKDFVEPGKHFGQWLQVPVSPPKEKGYLVKTKYGAGRTKHSDHPIQGKLPVYLTDGRKVLMKPQNIKIIGFID